MSFLPGVALIINYSIGRCGSDKDVIRLDKTLAGINVKVRIDIISTENDDQLENIVRKFIDETNFENFQYVIIACFTHGRDDGVLKVGLQSTTLQKSLLDPLFEVNTLRGKLKWIIVQACAGKYDCHGMEYDNKPGQDMDTKEKHKYYVKSFPSCEGGLAYRTDRGSVYIEKLCDELDKSASTAHLLKILRKTSKNVSDSLAKENYKQIPMFQQNFETNFYFTNGFEQCA